MSELTPTTVVPRHVRWFAPWTWNFRAFHFWLLIITLPFLYAYSAGPAVWLVGHQYLSPKMVEKAYRPLFALYVDQSVSLTFRRYTDYLMSWDPQGTNEVWVHFRADPTSPTLLLHPADSSEGFPSLKSELEDCEKDDAEIK